MRLLFSAEGDWLTLDNANPLEGWSMPEVEASGKSHGVNAEDIFGCLFYHVKKEFEKFACQLRDLDITIHVTGFDATSLSKIIAGGLGRPFGLQCFDRVETSNVADYIGVSQVLEDWSPLLNRDNKHAALLVYFMNWHVNQHGATAYSDTTALEPLIRRASSVLVSHLVKVFT